MLALIAVFCGTLLAWRRRVEKEEAKEEEKEEGVEPRRQKRREKEGSRMSKGTRVPFQTLSHSFFLKRADVCAHGRAPHVHARTHADARRERRKVHAEGEDKKEAQGKGGRG